MIEKKKPAKNSKEPKKAPKKEPKKAAAKKVKKTYHHGDLRHALLVAARAELAAVGRDHLSLRSVARRADVTHTAAYHHFADKAALLGALAGEGFAALDAAMATEMAAVGPGALDRMLASGRGYLKMAAADPAAYDLMFNTGVEPSMPANHAGGDPFQRLFDAVVEARRETKTETASPMVDAMVMWECVHGCAMLGFSGRLKHLGLDPAAHAEEMLARLGGLFRHL